MRSSVGLAASLLLSMAMTQVYASSRNTEPIDQEAIQAMEAKISQAEPRYQCFLYARLVDQVTEVSVKQYAAGDVKKATGLLKKVQQLAQKIERTVTRKDKRLKNAELLLHNTSFRLTQLLHSSSYPDREVVAQTLAQVNQAERKALIQVFGN